ncbi:MAG: hypothetical protein MUE62_11725 [Burkholderiaceae bacterium]|jgi:hypothetical protein|nr:hypothetical protein [Burkholderiaceae bacterium]
MSSLRKLLAGVVVLAAPHVVVAQVVWWAGAAWGPWGPWAPAGPVIVDSPHWGWSSGWGRGAYQYDLPSCYRIGRCSLDDIVRHFGRPDDLARLAPAAPASPPVFAHETRRVEPTDPKQVQPAYAGSGDVRPQFAASGSVRE